MARKKQTARKHTGGSVQPRANGPPIGPVRRKKNVQISRNLPGPFSYQPSGINPQTRELYATLRNEGTGMSSDVTLRVYPVNTEQGGRAVEFQAHRAILMGSSPYFQAMMRAHMCESSTGTVAIKDTDPYTFGLLLDVAYFQKIEVDHLVSVVRLFILAKMYDIDGLVQATLDYLTDNTDCYCAPEIILRLYATNCSEIALPETEFDEYETYGSDGFLPPLELDFENFGEWVTPEFTCDDGDLMSHVVDCVLEYKENPAGMLYKYSFY